VDPGLSNDELITIATSSLNLILLRIMVEAAEGLTHPVEYINQLANARDILDAAQTIRVLR